jgi:acetyl-CoA acyltransferase
MKRAVVVDGVRTPIGRSHADRGFFRHVRSDDLAAACIAALVDRTGIDPAEIEDVLLGCSKQTRSQGMNVARIAALLAGLPAGTAAVTINRLCGSSLQALNQATHSIAAGAEDVQIVGGLEHMHHLPLGTDIEVNPKLFRRTSRAALQQGLTAEYLARSKGVSRSQQDRFAWASHRRAAAAQASGQFRREIVPVYGHHRRGYRILVDRDQCVRPETSLESLAALPPVFLPEQGTVTAGNSSPINDGAAALLVMSEDRARSLRLQPLVRIRATAVAGVQPSQMGLGPVPAVRKALDRTGLQLADIDLVELNEAFAAQAIACIRSLDLDAGRVNVRGGAIALGHPLGASGARIVTTLINAMLDQDASLGLAAMCVGLGQGVATVLERV